MEGRNRIRGVPIGELGQGSEEEVESKKLVRGVDAWRQGSEDRRPTRTSRSCLHVQEMLCNPPSLQDSHSAIRESGAEDGEGAQRHAQSGRLERLLLLAAAAGSSQQEGIPSYPPDSLPALPAGDALLVQPGACQRQDGTRSLQVHGAEDKRRLGDAIGR
eukprot:763338-Hanusia_phi.AAC.8